MKKRVAVEVTDSVDSQTQRQLLAWAYRMSREGTVILMLNGVNRETVDRFMDPIVADEGVNVAGVRYVDAWDGRSTDTLQRATTVITSTGQLCGRLRSMGIDAVLAGPELMREPVATS